MPPNAEDDSSHPSSAQRSPLPEKIDTQAGHATKTTDPNDLFHIEEIDVVYAESVMTMRC